MKKVFIEYPAPDSTATFNTDQTVNHNFIKSFDKALTETFGLIRVESEQSLNLDNLPHVNLQQTHVNSGVGAQGGNIIHNIGYLEYTFNDELNNEHPVYIQFNFKYMFIMNVALTNFNANYKYHVPVVTISIYKVIDGVKKISLSDIRVTYQLSVNSNAGTIQYASYYNLFFSNGFNNNNSLFLNICPNMGYFTAGHTINFSTRQVPYISFYLKRLNDGKILFLSFTHDRLTNSASAADLTARVFQSYTYYVDEYNNVSEHNGYVTNSIYRLSMLESGNTFAIKNPTLTPLKIYDPINNDVIVIDDLLVCPKEYIASNIFQKVKVIKSDNIIHNYISASTDKLSIVDASGIVQLLIRDTDDEE